MGAIWHVYRREVGAFFTGPIAYVVITLFLVITDVFFFSLVRFFVERYGLIMMQAQMQGMPPDFHWNANEIIMANLFGQIAVVMLFLAPMITMRLLAEENQLGTMELLLTTPVRHLSVILGKFLAAMTVFVVMLGLSMAYPIWLSFHAPALEMGPILTGYLGLLLLAAAFTGVGLFFSSITENQIIAGALTFATLLFLWLLAALVNTETVTGGLEAFLEHASIILRFQNFSDGVISLGDSIYYLTVAALGVFFTLNVLDAKTT